MPQFFDIKSAQLPLLALLLKTADLKAVGQELLAQFGPNGESPDFFENDGLILDLQHCSGTVQRKDLQGFLKAAQSCNLNPLAFRQADPEWARMALGQGLVEAPAEPVRSHTAAAPACAPVREVVKEVQVVQEVVKEVIREVVREVPVPGPATLVIDKPLRSGQKVYARGADLVVLAMVNQGAEVAADGHIHVYAPLRGKAMAGATGNTQARIFSLCLEPELISIAGVYRTSEHPLAPDVQGHAAQVRLSSDGQEKLIFEALKA